MRFKEITGHTELKGHLARSIDAGRVSHAQIFTGLPGYGALPVALAYAQYLNCTAPVDGDSCGVCSSCVKMSKLEHPDLHFVFPVNSASKSGSQKPTSDYFLPQWRETVARTGGYFDEGEWYRSIEIENLQGIISRAEADEVVRKLSFKSFEGRYKVVIIWLPERMRVEAANSLLKILEEPWERTVFLMVSPAPQQLLPTIISRVQETAIPRIEEGDMAGYLKGLGVVADKAAAIVRLSAGDKIAAQAMVSQHGGAAQEEYFEMFKQLMRLSYNDKHMELIEWAETACSMGREQLKGLFTYCARMLRESYMMSAGMDAISYLWGDEREFCSRFAPFIGNHNIEALIDEITTASRQVAGNGNVKIIMPHFALTVSKMIVKR